MEKKTISNGKRGRNPTAPSKELYDAFARLGVEENDTAQDLVKQVAEFEDSVADEIEEQAEQRRVEKTFKESAQKLDKEKLQKMLAEING